MEGMIKLERELAGVCDQIGRGLCGEVRRVCSKYETVHEGWSAGSFERAAVRPAQVAHRSSQMFR